jgi:hypothetical protein
MWQGNNMCVDCFMKKLSARSVLLSFMSAVTFCCGGQSATLTVNGAGGPVVYGLVGGVGGVGGVSWQTAAGIPLSKGVLQSHLNSDAIRPHCPKEVVRLVMAQESLLRVIAIGGPLPVAQDYNVLGNSSYRYVDLHVNDIPDCLEGVKNHLLEQGHLGFYPMLVGAGDGGGGGGGPMQKVNKNMGRGIFNVISTTPAAVTSHFYGAAVGVPAPPPGVALGVHPVLGGVAILIAPTQPVAAGLNPIANAGRFHLFPNIQDKDMANFFAASRFNGYKLDSPVPPLPAAAIAAAVVGANTANWYAAFDAITAAAGVLTFTQLADGLLSCIFSQGNLRRVAISNAVGVAFADDKFTIDSVLDPSPFVARGLLNDRDWIGVERDNYRYTNAVRIPVEVTRAGGLGGAGFIRFPTVFLISDNLGDPLLQLGQLPTRSFLCRLWSFIPDPVKYVGTFVVGGCVVYVVMTYGGDIFLSLRQWMPSLINAGDML